MTEFTPPALAPHLVCDGAAAAIDFYKQAFGAEEMMRLAGPDGKIMHAAVAINGATVMLVDENRQFGLIGPKSLGGTPVTLHIYVDNADSAIDRAAGAGATVRMPASDQFWGDRYGVVEDPFGHRWSIAHQLAQRPDSDDELRAAAQDATCGFANPTAA